MKQFFLLTVLFSLLSIAGLQAQDCPYSKAAEASKACPHPTKMVKAATMDESIEKRVDETSGKAVYVRKEVCATTGRVTYTPVEYCSKSGKFVNVSPREKECVKSKAKCTPKGASATKVSNGEKINCTAAQKAACAKACTKAKASSSASSAPARVVKN